MGFSSCRVANFMARSRYSLWISRAETSRPFAKRTATRTGHVVADLPDGPNRVLERHVAQDNSGFLQHAQHETGRPDLEEGGVLAHVRVAHDHVESPVALRIGMGLIAGVDDRTRPGGRARHALPYVLGSLADAVQRAPRRLQHLAGTGVDLPADQERNEHLGVARQVVAPVGHVVLVTAVAVARGVGVVLEQVDVAVDALFVQPLFGATEQLFENSFARLVVHHQVVDGVALGGGVLGVRADVEVQPSAVGQEDVAAAAPRHHAAEQVASNLVGAQTTLTALGAGDAVLVLDTEDPSLHAPVTVLAPTAGNRHRPLRPATP